MGGPYDARKPEKEDRNDDGRQAWLREEMGWRLAGVYNVLIRASAAGPCARVGEQKRKQAVMMIT